MFVAHVHINWSSVRLLGFLSLPSLTIVCVCLYVCVCVCVCVQVIEEDGLQENARRVGGVLLQEMMSLRDEFEFARDTRGQGLMLRMELVKSKV